MSGSTCQALVITVENDSPKLVKKAVPLPKPESNQALVKISYAAQNPTDVQAFDANAFGDGSILGCDFVGTVEETGSKVSRLAKGDVVAGLIWGGEIKGLGAFSAYTVVDERICFKIPSGLPLEEASTVPLAAATSWLALFSKKSLAIDREKGKKISVLIWGGSSSVGLYAIQIASLYGFNIITTCSPRHFDLVRSYGAHHVFDYKDDDVVNKIKQASSNIAYIFDTIGNSTSSTLASQTLEKSGVLCTVRPGKANTEKVTAQTKVTDVLVWTAFLKEHRYAQFHWPADEGDHALASEFFEKLPTLLQEGKIKPSTPKVIDGGLDAIPKGFQEHRDGKISAYKIVYKI